MSIKIIGIKQLYTNLKNITKETSQGTSFLVVKNSKPTFKIVPLNNNHDNNQFTLDDLKDVQFEGGNKNMSQKIDKYLY
ncbi:MAG: hypothetical protein GWP10_07720 [Nitrospiraceae bacterium]|nr:hypothetical protein [Nitrospiraceae bacterium]